MILVLKGVDIAGDYLADHTPPNLEFFELSVTLTIGPIDDEGGSLYQLRICTPEWLKYAVECESANSAFWGRHMLIVEKFNVSKIEALIADKLQDIVSNYPNATPVELSKKVGRYAHWEYEDYVS